MRELLFAMNDDQQRFFEFLIDKAGFEDDSQSLSLAIELLKEVVYRKLIGEKLAFTSEETLNLTRITNPVIDRISPDLDLADELTQITEDVRNHTIQ